MSSIKHMFSVAFLALVSGLLLMGSGTLLAQTTMSAGGTMNSVFIPDGPNPSCGTATGNIIRHRVTIPGPLGPLTSIVVEIGIYHPRASDVNITLVHNGIVVVLVQQNCFASPIFNGIYTLSALGSSTLMSGAPANFQVPVNTNYLPTTSFSVFNGFNPCGDWELSINDHQQGPSFGPPPFLNHFKVTVTTTVGASFGIWQPVPSNASPSGVWNPDTVPASSVNLVSLCNVGLASGVGYINAMTLQAGVFPNGWFHGIDIGLAQLAEQINHGPPFYSPSVSGTAPIVFSGSFPASLIGVPIYIASSALAAGGNPISPIAPMRVVLR